jgi:hypothetical protein
MRATRCSPRFDVPDDHATLAFLEARTDAARHDSPVPVGWLVVAEIVDRIAGAQHTWPSAGPGSRSSCTS